ncbi:hypothetical protein PQQ96_25660 [Paraburkholderia sediminicola]
MKVGFELGAVVRSTNGWLIVAAPLVSQSVNFAPQENIERV